MYFKYGPSVETEHCIIVKGLTPPGPSDEYVNLYFYSDKMAYPFPLSRNDITSYNLPLGYIYDGRSYVDRLADTLGVPYRGFSSEPSECFDSTGTKTGDVHLENQYDSWLSARNLSDSTITALACVKAKIPELTYYFNTNKTNKTLSATNSYMLRPTYNLGDVVYGDTWTCPWAIPQPPFDRIHATNFKLFDANDIEVPWTPTDSVYMAKNGSYVKLTYGASEPITAAYLKFKFPWPELT